MTPAEIFKAAELSKEVYHSDYNLKDFNVELIKTLSDSKTDTQGFIAIDHELKKYWVVFRGTKGFVDILTDVDFYKKEYKFKFGEAKVHSGMLSAFESVRAEIDSVNFDEHSDYEIICTGHSLGAALATLTAATCFPRKPSIATFGSPRVGDSDFKKAFVQAVSSSTRVVFEADAITELPPLQGYRHVPTMLRIDSDGKKLYSFSLWLRLVMSIFTLGRSPKSAEVISITDHFSDNYVNALRKYKDLEG
jgi:predicted lipase